MTYTEDELRNILVSRFEQALSQSDLKIKLDDLWRTATLENRFDIVIYKGVYPVAVIEIKNSLESKKLLSIATSQVRSAISIINARFGIITDNEKFYLFDRNKNELDFRSTSFNDIIIQLVNPETIKVEKQDREVVLKIIIDAANKHLKKNQEFLSFISGTSFLSRILFDYNSNTYFFSDDDGGITAFENQFFNKMFGEFKESQICRYTSFNSIYEMLNSVSFRMNGLVGMNDKSEVNYVESYLNKGSDQITIEKPLYKEHYNTIIAINSRYITSCTTIKRKDELTLWRLYSDDAKGVCLVYEIRQRNLNKHVLLQKVKYADENGKHPELDFLKEIKDQVEDITGFKFEFRKLGYWKHFFKAKDYSIEDEVRLLIIDNDSLIKIDTSWVMTYSHSILNPVINFQLNSKTFPIQLKEIVLGPKCIEQETNLVQLQEMIRRKKNEIKSKKIDSNLKELKVSLSQIKHYR